MFALPFGRERGRPPGPSGLPVIGNLHKFAREPFEFMTRCGREYGPVVAWEIGERDSYLVTGPTEIERVLVHDNQDYVKGKRFQQAVGPVLGRGVLTSEGEKWRRQRHLVQPAFHPDRIEGYAGIMTDLTEETIEDWQDGETRDVHADMMALTLRIVSRALFGVDLRDRTDEVGEALGVVTAHAEKMSSRYVPPSVPTPENRRFQRATERLEAIVDEIVAERREDPSDDVISALLAASDKCKANGTVQPVGEGRGKSDGEGLGKAIGMGRKETDGDGRGDGMTPKQIRDEVMTLLLAGHETTALALTYTFFLLGQYTAVDETLFEEVDSVVEGSAPAIEDVEDLEYAERVVKESMRLYPPVFSILREPIRDVELGGYHIPAGSTLTLAQWVVHRDPRYYRHPMAFRPERWTDGFAKELPRFAYFPFAGGPRRCLGDRFAMIEAQLVLATIAKRYQLELVSSPSIDRGAGITMRPKDPIRVVVRER